MSSRGSKYTQHYWQNWTPNIFSFKMGNLETCIEWNSKGDDRKVINLPVKKGSNYSRHKDDKGKYVTLASPVDKSIFYFLPSSTREVFWVSGENPKARSPPFSSSVLVSTVHAVSDCRETSFNPSWLIVVLSSISFIFYFRLTRQCLQIFEFRASVKSTSGNLALVENENPECSKPRTFDRSAPNLKDDTSCCQWCSFPITNKLGKLDKQNIKPP